MENIPKLSLSEKVRIKYAQENELMTTKYLPLFFTLHTLVNNKQLRFTIKDFDTILNERCKLLGLGLGEYNNNAAYRDTLFDVLIEREMLEPVESHIIYTEDTTTRPELFLEFEFKHKGILSCVRLAVVNWYEKILKEANEKAEAINLERQLTQSQINLNENQGLTNNRLTWLTASAAVAAIISLIISLYSYFEMKNQTHTNVLSYNLAKSTAERDSATFAKQILALNSKEIDTIVKIDTVFIPGSDSVHIPNKYIKSGLSERNTSNSIFTLLMLFQTLAAFFGAFLTYILLAENRKEKRNEHLKLLLTKYAHNASDVGVVKEEKTKRFNELQAEMRWNEIRLNTYRNVKVFLIIGVTSFLIMSWVIYIMY